MENKKESNKEASLKEAVALSNAAMAIFDVLLDTFARYSNIEDSFELKKHSANFVMTMRLERKK